MTKVEHKSEIARVIEYAGKADLCDVVVIGTKPNGGGLYLDWSGTTVASFVLMIEAAKASAIEEYRAGLGDT